MIRNKLPDWFLTFFGFASSIWILKQFRSQKYFELVKYICLLERVFLDKRKFFFPFEKYLKIGNKYFEI